MEENREQPENSIEKPERVQNKNLKRDAGPGRPLGQRNYASIYRDALIKLAKVNNMDPEDLETEILSKAILKSRSGDYRFFKDIQDRLHGKPQEKIDITSKGQQIYSAQEREEADKAIDQLLNGSN